MKHFDLGAREKSWFFQDQLSWVNYLNEFSIDLKVCTEWLVIRIFLEFDKERAFALSYSLCEPYLQSSQCLLQANLARIAEAYKLNLSIRMRRVSDGSTLNNMAIWLGLLPDVCDSCHIAVDVKREKVLIIMETVNFVYTLH